MLKPAKDSLDLGIIVSDIEASLAFYRDFLGLEYIGNNPVWFGTLHRLRFGGSDFKLIAPDKAPPAGSIGLDKALGLRYVTFVVSNIEETCQACKDKGIVFEREMAEIRPGTTIAMVHDPDGNIVEFVQRG